MAKRKSLFDDKSVEIEELTYIIKQVRGHLKRLTVRSVNIWTFGKIIAILAINHNIRVCTLNITYLLLAENK